jgi:hypothetical protein
VKFIAKKSKCADLTQERKLVFLHQIRATCRGWLKVQCNCGVRNIECRQERTFHLFEMPRIIFFSLFLMILHALWVNQHPHWYRDKKKKP